MVPGVIDSWGPLSAVARRSFDWELACDLTGSGALWFAWFTLVVREQVDLCYGTRFDEQWGLVARSRLFPYPTVSCSLFFDHAYQGRQQTHQSARDALIALASHHVWDTVGWPSHAISRGTPMSCAEPRYLLSPSYLLSPQLSVDPRAEPRRIRRR